MDNFFLSELSFDDLYQNIFDRSDIVDMYFKEDIKIEDLNIEKEESNLEELLTSFESESEDTLAIKIGILREIKKNNIQYDKYTVFYIASSYINKYFYNMNTYQDLEIFEFNKLAA